jgi:hypothetical protein
MESLEFGGSFFGTKHSQGVSPTETWHRTLLSTARAWVCVPAFSTRSFPLPRNKRTSRPALAELKRRSNVFGSVHPFHQGEGRGRLGGAPAPRIPVVVRGDQELQGGGAHPETRSASAVAAAADAAQDADSVHTSDLVAAPENSEAGSSSSDVGAATAIS